MEDIEYANATAADISSRQRPKRQVRAVQTYEEQFAGTHRRCTGAQLSSDEEEEDDEENRRASKFDEDFEESSEIEQDEEDKEDEKDTSSGEEFDSEITLETATVRKLRKLILQMSQTQSESISQDDLKALEYLSLDSDYEYILKDLHESDVPFRGYRLLFRKKFSKEGDTSKSTPQYHLFTSKTLFKEFKKSD